MKYTVKYHETYVRSYEIEAATPEEAERKIMEAIRNGEVNPPEECSESGCEVLPENPEEEKEIWTAAKETGTFIEKVESIEAGLNLISQYEEWDKTNHIFEPGFYDIVNREHISVL